MGQLKIAYTVTYSIYMIVLRLVILICFYKAVVQLYLSVGHADIINVRTSADCDEHFITYLFTVEADFNRAVLNFDVAFVKADVCFKMNALVRQRLLHRLAHIFIFMG